MTAAGDSANADRSATDEPGPALSPYRIDRLRLRHLRLLELIHLHGSLGAASRRLGVSQPAATVLLQELEVVVGKELVGRDARGARLTVAGLRAMQRLEIALASVEHAFAAAATELPPLLRLGCAQVAGVSVLAHALARLERDGNLGRITIREGRARDLISALCKGDLDCVVGWIDESLGHALPMGELHVAPLWSGGMQVVASSSHPLVEASGLTVADLVPWRWIVPPGGSRTQAAYLRLFVQAGLSAPPVTVECAALHTMLSIVGATRLLAIAPAEAVRHYERSGLVVQLGADRFDLGRERFSVVTRRDSDGMAALAHLRHALLAEREAHQATG